MKSPIVSAQRNEQRIKCVLQLVVSSSDVSPEYKAAFKMCACQVIEDIRERGISTYHALIDYLYDKANQCIEGAEDLSSKQKIEWKCFNRLLAELAKLRRCSQSSFWPGKHRNKIMTSSSISFGK